MTDTEIKAAKARAVEGESCDDPNVRIAICDEALRRGDRIRELENHLSLMLPLAEVCVQNRGWTKGESSHPDDAGTKAARAVLNRGEEKP